MRAIIKRIIFITAIVLFAVAIRIYDNGLLSATRTGKYTVFDSADNATVYDETPLFGSRLGYERIDTVGSYADASAFLDRLNACVIKYEEVDDITIIYAYSNRIEKQEIVFNEKVNIMIALSNGNMVVGSPLIKGSY